jgi:RNA polymerase sigma-70 factor (ECF subfamily)
MEDGGRFATAFLAVCPVEGSDSTALGSRLGELVDAGRAAWPAVTMDPERFCAHLGRHAGATPLGYLEAVHAGDLYLACAVLGHDPAALEAFDRAFIGKVDEYVARVTVERDLIDEVKQALRERLVLGGEGGGKIADYSGQGALGGWVRIAAVRTALNLLRGRRPERPVSEDAPTTARDPELAFAQARGHDLFRAAFTDAIAALDVQQRTMLRLHYVEGLTMDQLSAMYGTPRSTVARRVDEVRRKILAATEQRLRDEHRLSPSEIASVFRGANSQFHLTLTKILK